MLKQLWKFLRGIHSIEVMSATRGWPCEVYFSVNTRRQCTNEFHTVRAGSRRLLLSVPAGLLAGFREYRRLQALPGEHEVA